MSLAATDHNDAGLREESVGATACLRRGTAGPAATPIVLLHGIGSSASSFAPLVRMLPADCPVIAWHAPGYGPSVPLQDASTVDADAYARRLEALLDGLGTRRCILVGHSLGAVVAGRFARRHGGRVAALILISPALGFGSPAGAPLPPQVVARIEELDRLGAAAFAELRAPRLVADPENDAQVVATVRRAMAGIARPGYDHACRLLAGADLLTDAAFLSVPTLVIVGDDDRITPPANAERLFEALPAGLRRDFGRIAAAGHAVCQERPGEVAAAIGTFLREGTDG